jgi:hypothetical protein
VTSFPSPSSSAYVFHLIYPELSASLANTLQPNGVEKANNPLEGITEKEKALLAKAIEGLKGNISKGIQFAHNPPQK